MSAAPSAVLLDTSILVHLVRGKAVGERIRSDHALLTGPGRPLISVVTIGELLALAQKFAWGRAKQAVLEELVRNVIVVQLNQGEILRRYAEIDYYLEKLVKPANPIGQNDLWIAATAVETGSALMTMDKDFDALTPRYMNVIRIDPHTGATA